MLDFKSLSASLGDVAAEADFLSIMVSVSEKDKLSFEDDGASLLILLSFLMRVSVGGARAVSSGFLEEVLSFEVRRRLLRRLSGGSVCW